jgi:hypothetical protein
MSSMDPMAAARKAPSGGGDGLGATSVALGAASAEMGAAAVQSAAAGAAELAAATAMGGLAQALANEGANRVAGARGADQSPPGKALARGTRPAPKPATRAASKRAPRKPPKSKK